jgi:tRNA modification GTPase
LAEWLGRALQKLAQRFESARRLNKPLLYEAKKPDDVARLKSALLKLVDTGALNTQSTVVSNSRHYDALIRALESLDRVQEGVNSGISGDLLAIDLQAALLALGEITGAITNDDLLGHIFANFCIGK